MCKSIKKIHAYVKCAEHPPKPIKTVRAIPARKKQTESKSDSNNRFDIYYDSLTEATWFSELNPAFNLESNNYHNIKRRGSNIDIIDAITAYDKPDIILLKNNQPLLVIEITSEVPTGHNVGQRFARLVKAIELGIPAIYYFPFDAKKHGKHSSICNLNIRLLAAAKRMYEIHNTPLLCVNWPTDKHGELITDGTENEVMISLLKSYVDSNFDPACSEFMNHLTYMENEYKRRLDKRPSYRKMPPSVTKSKTEVLVEEYQLRNVPATFSNRQYSFVYQMDMTPSKCNRQDPYTGTAFIYDYLACRTGKSVEEKSSNLVLSFPKITVDTWRKTNPNNTSTKSCNWYLTANLMLFKDGYIWIRG